MSWQRSIALLLGGAAAGVAVYDFFRGKMFPTLTADDIRSAKDQVVSADWVKHLIKLKSLKKPPIVITSVNQIEPMIQDMGLEHQRKLITDIVRGVTERSENALAVEGNKHNYLILPERVGKAVVEHEMGHLRSREEGKEEPSTFIDHIASLFWKPSYRKTVIEPEEAAWSYVKDKSLREKAIGSYERGFHRQRSSFLGQLGAVLLLGGLLTPP